MINQLNNLFVSVFDFNLTNLFLYIRFESNGLDSIYIIMRNLSFYWWSKYVDQAGIWHIIYMQFTKNS